MKVPAHLKVSHFTLPTPLVANINKSRVARVPGARHREKYRAIVDNLFDEHHEAKWGVLRRFLGTATMHLNPTRKFLFAYGAGGRNGKSLLLGAMVQAMGGYGQNAPLKMLSRSHRSGGDHRADLASLRYGVRLIHCDEQEAQAVWDFSLLKTLVSESTVSIRGAYDKKYHNRPITFHIACSSNYKPPMDEWDQALADRMLFIHFDKTFTYDEEIHTYSQSVEFQEALMDDMMEGLAEYKRFLAENRDGLRVPQCCLDEIEEMRGDLNPVATYVDECLEPALRGQEKDSKADIYRHLTTWLTREGYSQMEDKDITRELAKVSVSSYSAKDSTGRGFRGLKGKRKVGLRIKDEARSDRSPESF